MSKMKKSQVLAGVLLIITGIVGYVAYRTRAVPTPKRRWKRFDDPDTIPLDAAACSEIQGVYKIEEGNHFFGVSAVIKCSYTVEDGKRINRLSLFCEKNGTYIISEARKIGSSILLSGHWRKASANGSGIVWLEIKRTSKVERTNEPGDIVINGLFGINEDEPSKPVSLR